MRLRHVFTEVYSSVYFIRYQRTNNEILQFLFYCYTKLYQLVKYFPAQNSYINNKQFYFTVNGTGAVKFLIDSLIATFMRCHYIEIGYNFLKIIHKFIFNSYLNCSELNYSLLDRQDNLLKQRVKESGEKT